MKEFGVLALVIVVLIFVAIVIIKYENKILISNSAIVEYGSIENEAGQKIVNIQYEKLGSWIKQNSNAKIVSLASIGGGVYGRITSFVIVYEAKE